MDIFSVGLLKGQLLWILVCHFLRVDRYLHFSWEIPRSGMAVSCGRCVFSISRNCHAVFQSGGRILHSTSCDWEFRVLPVFWSKISSYILATSPGLDICFIEILVCTLLLSFSSFKIFYLFIFKDGREKGGRKRGKETLMCGCLSHALYWRPGPATQACALTGSRTSDPLVHRLALNPLSHTSQDYHFLNMIVLAVIEVS